jgi:hypothetical protein
MSPSWDHEAVPNWIVSILSQMEQQPLYDAINWTVPWPSLMADPANAGVRSQTIETLLCPSDSAYNKTPYDGSGHNVRGPNATGNHGPGWARGNYAANVSRDFMQNGGVWATMNRGVMGHAVSLDFAGITDGSSNVVIVGEVRADIAPQAQRGTWALANGGSALYAYRAGDCHGPNAPNDNSDDVRSCDASENAVGGGANLARMGMGCWGGGGSWTNQTTIRSQHPGGAQVGLGDGSGHFMADTIDLIVFERVMCSGDNNPVDWP